MDELRARDTGRLALAIGAVAAGSAVCLATYFIVRGPFGTFNDIGNAATGVLSGWLAWRLRRHVEGRAASVAVGARWSAPRSRSSVPRWSFRARPDFSSPGSCRASASRASALGSWSLNRSQDVVGGVARRVATGRHRRRAPSWLSVSSGCRESRSVSTTWRRRPPGCGSGSSAGSGSTSSIRPGRSGWGRRDAPGCPGSSDQGGTRGHRVMDWERAYDGHRALSLASSDLTDRALPIPVRLKSIDATTANSRL